ncbi:RidA family protein [Burkholderia oklahomensis]|uniref:Endoribonuclease L-PSP family protein n=1 Tax=Burkholderia oklahomensis TaxID=342113 RepID=A0AAI8B736_9BURK|nr:RidA family protein [Burkholderia oklahomensis]AIO66805.1 endoribonuclease L-PSP family protein [Burkholderia oklahomensis]AJX33124.1 endoribonuclease L-PSP family protein [Burkholderia oklahomensis C6786]AOI41651.1 hypothetical protein WG70_18380 [Burkholderia oklahomensis EO147]AOI45237.1 hypothetical protein WI23_05135 [Burkholderia oklahomensis C6786]KUY59540.1 hypothetical protein WI23_15920 [Burkholderia oklahomensis C6786]
MRTRYESGSSWEDAFGFSRAVRVGNLLFVSKTGPLGPDGTIASDDVGEQTDVVLKKIAGILADADFGVGDVVQSRMYLTDIAHWRRAAAVHGRFFRDVRPAFSLLHVLPFPEKDMRVAIEVLACKDG